MCCGCPAGGQYDGVSRAGPDLAGDQIAGDDPHRPSLVEHDIEHLGAGEQLDSTELDLASQRLVGAEEKLLSGLTPCIERPGNLGSSERPVVEETTVLTDEQEGM